MMFQNGGSTICQRTQSCTPKITCDTERQFPRSIQPRGIGGWLKSSYRRRKGQVLRGPTTLLMILARHGMVDEMPNDKGCGHAEYDRTCDIAGRRGFHLGGLSLAEVEGISRIYVYVSLSPDGIRAIRYQNNVSRLTVNGRVSPSISRLGATAPY